MKQKFPLSYKLFAFSVIFLIGEIVYITLSSQFYTFFTNDEIRMADGQYYVYLLIVSAFFSIVLTKGRGGLTRFVLLCLIWGGTQALQFLFLGYSFIALIRQLTWVLFLAFLFITTKEYGANLFFKLFILLLTVLLGYSIVQMVFIKTQTSYTGSISVIYWVLLGMPFGFIIKQKWLKVVYIVAFVFMALLSLKATALVATGSSLLIAYYIKSHDNKKKTSSLFLFAFVLIILFLIIPIVSGTLESTLNLNWNEKTDESMETGGSGRLMIWGLAFHHILNSSIGDLLFGHGHNRLVNVIYFSAHNDFLEVLYDYGVIMFLIYIGLYVQLIKIQIRMIKTHYEYATAFAVSLMVFFSLSMFSHLMIYPGLMLMLGAFWGLCLGDYEYNKKKYLKK